MGRFFRECSVYALQADALTVYFCQKSGINRICFLFLGKGRLSTFPWIDQVLGVRYGVGHFGTSCFLFEPSRVRKCAMSFSTTTEEISSTRRKYKISAPSTFVSEAFKNALNEVKSGAQIKGFRKGKVPDSLVKKFFIQDIAKKAYETVVDAGFAAAVKDSTVQVVSFPEINPVGQFDENSDFVFDATVDVNPIVDIAGYKELALELNSKDLVQTAKEVQTIKGNMLYSKAKLAKKVTDRPSALQDMVQFDVEAKIDGAPVAELASKASSLILGRQNNTPEFEAALLGLECGAQKTFSWTVPETFGIEAVRGKVAEMTVTLTSIQPVEIPAWDDAFAVTAGAESLEKLSENLEQVAQARAKQVRISLVREQVLSKILAQNPIEVPGSLLEDTVDRLIQDTNTRAPKTAQLDPKNAETRNRFKEQALEQVRGVLILGHIARQEELTVTDAEVSQEVIQFARQNNIAPQEIINRFGRQVIEEFRGKVLIDKAMERVVELAKITELT